MSSQSAFNTTSIILAIVGLIIGAGGGYFIANSSAQSQISELNNEILSLSETVTGLETQLNENEVEIETLEKEVTDLESEVTDLESEATTKDTAITELETEITSKENTITLLEEQIESMTAITEVKEGYIQYSIYGFTFEYPNDMVTSLGGVLESSATENSGVLIAERESGEAYSVTWMHSRIELDVEGAIEGGYEAISELVTSRSGYEIIEHRGHTVTYEEYTLREMTESYTMILGVFYCPESDKFFNINYIDQTQNTFETWLEFIESFVCHIE